MKMVCFQSSTQWFLCAFEFLSFFIISDLTYSTVMCHEACKFPVIYTLVSVCAFELSFLLYDLVIYHIALSMCYEDGKFPVVGTMISCVFELCFLLMIFYLTYSTVICCEGGGQSTVFHTSISCALLSRFLSFFMISDLSYSTVFCYEDA